MASVFDVTHYTGHAIAGLLGVGGFPVAVLLLSVDLGHTEEWLGARRALLWIANLSWISVVLLIATLVLMTMQLARANEIGRASCRERVERLGGAVCLQHEI